MNKLVLAYAVVLAVVMGASQAHADTVYASYLDKSKNPDGVTVRDASNLDTQKSYFDTKLSGAASGITLLNDTLYITAGNGIYKYATNGNQINQFTWHDDSLSYTDVTTGNGRLYATYSGSQHGITIRDLHNLSQYSSFETGVAATGVIAGASNDLYITAGNSIYRYGIDGSVLNHFSWEDDSITYTDITIVNGKLLATYTGSQNGVTIRDLNSLSQYSSFETGVVATGITTGSNNDIYITARNGIYRYATNGSLNGQFKWGSNKIIYTDVAVASIPEPSYVALFALGLGVIAIASRGKPSHRKLS